MILICAPPSASGKGPAGVPQGDLPPPALPVPITLMHGAKKAPQCVLQGFRDYV